MAIDSQQFRLLVVRPVLYQLDPEIRYSPVAEELLMFTVAHESDMGRYLKQLGGGPALSVFMIEKPTFNWLFNSVLTRPAEPKVNWPNIRLKVHDITTKGTHDETIWNLQFATAIARLRYFVVKEPLPATTSAQALGDYWGRNYQTTNDPKKIREAIRDYLRYIKQ